MDSEGPRPQGEEFKPGVLEESCLIGFDKEGHLRVPSKPADPRSPFYEATTFNGQRLKASSFREARLRGRGCWQFPKVSCNITSRHS